MSDHDLKLPWFYVPPYRSEGHKVLNTDGEQVAVFEDRDEALAAVKAVNAEIEHPASD